MFTDKVLNYVLMGGLGLAALLVATLGFKTWEANHKLDALTKELKQTKMELTIQTAVADANQAALEAYDTIAQDQAQIAEDLKALRSDTAASDKRLREIIDNAKPEDNRALGPVLSDVLSELRKQREAVAGGADQSGAGKAKQGAPR